MKFLAVLLALSACEGRRKTGPMDQAAAQRLFEQVPLVGVPPGMSDLTIDDRGVLWGIAERDRKVVELAIGKPPIVHPLEGVQAGLDTEAIAWLGGGRFAIGIEGAMTPAAGIVFAELRGEALVATTTQPLLDADLGISLTINHGVEALCGRDGELLLAAETVGKLPDGKRWAPLVRLRGNTVHLTRLWLTTKAGKISALHCVIADDGTAEVSAIERHFGVARLLKFTLRRDDAEVTPVVELDLNPVVRDTFNLEGLTRLADGRLVMINDNQGKVVAGPTQLFVFHPR